MFEKKELIEGAASAISGFFGLTSFSFFWLPPSIKELGMFARGFVFCLLGFVVPYVFTRFILRRFGIEQPIWARKISRSQAVCGLGGHR